jgi:hypothetical protein
MFMQGSRFSCNGNMAFVSLINIKLTDAFAYAEGYVYVVHNHYWLDNPVCALAFFATDHFCGFGCHPYANRQQ